MTLQALANSSAVASVSPLADLCASAEITAAPFFNIFPPQRLGLLSEPEALNLIERPSTEHGHPLAPVKHHVLSLGGRQPFFLQIACRSWFEFLEVQGEAAESFPQDEPPADVLETFREESAHHFRYAVGALPDGEPAATQTIADGGDPDPSSAQGLNGLGYAMHIGGETRLSSGEFARFVLSRA